MGGAISFRCFESKRSAFALALLAIVCCAAPARSADTRKSGYAIGSDRCGDFPRLRIDMKNGFCAGLVVSEDDGLKFPRSIVQIPGSGKFVVTDMGGWGSANGRLLVLDPHAVEGKRISEALTGIDYPFGLVVGPDNKIYASSAETIFRFDPLAANPRSTIETIVQGLPGRKVRLSDGAVTDSTHPLKQFIFDRTGRLFVNIGSHSDNCLGAAPRLCPAGEGPAPLASIWMFTPPSGGIFPALKPNDPNPARETFATGLRNSMAFAMHPRFPEAGFAFLQAENSRDLQDSFAPNEEINAIEQGRHYGWPYCYDLTTPSPEFRAVLSSGKYRNFCNTTAVYKPPLSLLPPHGASLGMLYYRGSKFSELDGKLLVGLHGYRPTGSRVLIYDVDERGFPKLGPPPVRYNVSCGAESARAFQTSAGPVAAAAYDELISGWHRVNGIRPRGAPVGMAVAADGAIWLVEDRNQSVIRIDRQAGDAPEPLGCDRRTEAQIDEIVRFVAGDPQNAARLSNIRKGLIERHCIGCHSEFGLKQGQSDSERDQAALRFMLSQDGWIYPGDPQSGRLRTRLRGLGAEKLMPPGGESLARTEPGYARLLDYADELVIRMVPGMRMRLKPGPPERKFFSKAGKECGEIPVGKVVVVTQRNALDKPGYSRLYRPADHFLNGDCSDQDGYYIRQDVLVPL